METKTKIFIIFLSFSLLLSSCIKEEENGKEDFLAVEEGVFILSEGNFMNGNASLSYYDKKEKKIENMIFYRANAIPLGDVGQSIIIKNNIAYIVVNNSGKVCAVDINTYKLLGKITGLVSPRYMHFVSDEKAYISDLYSKCIYVVNPKTYSIIKKIDIDNHSSNIYEHSSEEMIQVGDFLYLNSWSYDNKILVVDTKNDTWVDSIEVEVQPRKMVKDKNNKLWVLCDGGYEGSSLVGEKAIVKINPENNTIENTIYIKNSNAVIDLKINKTGDTLYYINKNIYRFSETATTAPNDIFINGENHNFYSIGIDPNNSEIYVSDAIDYMQNGVVYRYNTNAIVVDSFRCGIIPSAMAFK